MRATQNPPVGALRLPHAPAPSRSAARANRSGCRLDRSVLIPDIVVCALIRGKTLMRGPDAGHAGLMLTTWRQQHLPEIVATLANRPGHEAVRTLVADILRYGFSGVAYHAIDHEVRLPGGSRPGRHAVRLGGYSNSSAICDRSWRTFSPGFRTIWLSGSGKQGAASSELLPTAPRSLPTSCGKPTSR